MMRGLAKLWGVALLATFGSASLPLAAQAQTNQNNITVTVKPYGDFNAGSYNVYEFTIKNNTNGTLNKAGFQAIANATCGGSPCNVGRVQFFPGSHEPELAECRSVDVNRLECVIGYSTTKLIRSGEQLTFHFGVHAPSDAESLTISWATRPGEGSFDGAGVIRGGVGPTSLAANTNDEVRSFAPPNGLFLVTGSGIPDGDHTTSIDVLPNKKVIVAKIKESLGGSNCSKRFCSDVDVTIDAVENAGTPEETTIQVPASYSAGDLADKLVIKMRIRAIPNLSIGGVTVMHEDTVLLPCSNGSKNFIPVSPPRCVHKRTAYTQKTAPDPSLIGVWEFIIFANSNGSFGLLF